MTIPATIPRRVLLTGAAGFTGSHILKYLLEHTACEVVAQVRTRDDRSLQRLRWATGDHWTRVTTWEWDLTWRHSGALADLGPAAGDIDAIMSVASNSRIGESIADPGGFISENTRLMIGTMELARQMQPDVVLHLSTDEVYGPTPDSDTRHSEWDPIRPGNPYAASKAAQEAIAHSYSVSYGIPLVIATTMTLFGEGMNGDKFIPHALGCLVRGETIRLQGTPETSPIRPFLHASRLASALTHILERQLWSAEQPTRWNVVASERAQTYALVLLLADAAGIDRAKADALIDFDADAEPPRPGHQRHAGLSGGTLALYGWQAPETLVQDLAATVQWFLANPGWLS
jgi:dTDP-glucose 4,6-dehydratase